MRARLLMEHAAWRDLDADERKAPDRMMATYGVTWSPVLNAAGAITHQRSCPLDVRDACEIRQRLADDHYFRAVRVAPVHTFAALAAVRIGGVHVVMGAGSPMVDARDAETRGTPVAIVAHRAVTPCEGAVYGHTDDELRAAPLLTRAQHADAGGAR